MIMEIQSGPLVMPNSLSLHLPFAILAYVKNKMRKERRRRRRTKNSFFSILWPFMKINPSVLNLRKSIKYEI